MQADLYDPALEVHAALVVQILVAEPELDHPAGSEMVRRGGIAELVRYGTGQTLAEGLVRRHQDLCAHVNGLMLMIGRCSCGLASSGITETLVNAVN